MRPAAGRGQLYAGTSGFAYPDWAPRFYPAGLRAEARLAHYSNRFTACELNNTFYRWPTEERIRAWLASTPVAFRFAIKAQRTASVRALVRDPVEEVARLTAPLALFGSRLGSILYRVPAELTRNDEGLAALLAAWPPTVPLTVEFQDPSWHVDETFSTLRAHGAVLCATDLPEEDLPPTLRLTGPFLYVRLRRHDYAPSEVSAWAARTAPFLGAGTDVFAFFRHDPVGRATELADQLTAAVEQILG